MFRSKLLLGMRLMNKWSPIAANYIKRDCFYSA